MKFTAEQIDDWLAYEKVRKGGKFNMFDPRARRATRLDEYRYKFVMRNFGAMRDCIAAGTKAA